MNRTKKVPFADAANALMHDFLQAMPEITVDITQVKIIERAYDGDSHRYIKTSFRQYLDKVFVASGRCDG